MTREVILAAALLCLVSAFALAGGAAESAQPEAPTTIQFWAWATTDKQEIINEALDAFHDGQDQVEVEFSAFPSGGYQEKIMSAVASGTAPDVSFTKISLGAPFAKDGVLVDMNPPGRPGHAVSLLQYRWLGREGIHYS